MPVVEPLDADDSADGTESLRRAKAFDIDETCMDGRVCFLFNQGLRIWQ